MEKLNKTCPVCLTKYSYCSSCQAQLKPRWMAMFDTENCMGIYFALSEYMASGEIDIAKEKLAAFDTDVVKNETMNETLKGILSIQTTIDAEEEPLAIIEDETNLFSCKEDEIVKEDSFIVSEEENITPKFSRKRKKKTNNEE